MKFKPSFSLSGVLSERDLCASLYNHAAALAEIEPGGAVFPVRSVRRIIERNFKVLSRRAGRSEKLSEFDKWLYDNNYMLENVLDYIALENRRFKKLPHFDGYPRIFTFCSRVVKAAECSLDERMLSNAINAFQQKTYFDYEELIYMPLAFKCAAAEYVAALIIRRNAAAAREEGRAKDLLLSKYSACAASALTFIRSLDDILQYDFILKHSVLNSILSEEKSGVYLKMREDSKGEYLSYTAYLSRRRNIGETDIAHAAVKLADAADENVKNHCGYYLYRDRQSLFNMLYDRNRKRKSRPKFYQLLYIAPCYLIAMCISLVMSGLIKSPWRFFYSTVAYPVFFHITKLAVTNIIKLFARPDRLPKMDFTGGIPAGARTAVVTSVLIADPAEMRKAVKNMAVNSFADTDPNIGYVLLADFLPSESGELSAADKGIIAAAKEALDALRSENKNSITIFFRKRVWHEKDKIFKGWERKRGAIMNLCEYYINGAGYETGEFSGKEQEKVTAYRYEQHFAEILGDRDFLPVNVVALDADTAAPPKAITELAETAAHPLNLKYNVLVPKIRTNILTTEDNLFTRLYADSAGFDSYSNTMFDIYQDIFHVGIYHGKGLFRLREYFDLLHETLPEDRILSHDLIEGAIAGAANVKTSLYDSYPSGYGQFLKRNLRWTRGDWQLLPYLLPKFITQSGKKRKNPLQPIARWQISDNINYSLMYPVSLLLLAFSPFFKGLFWVPVVTALSYFAIAFLTDVYVALKALLHKRRLLCAASDIWKGFLRLLFNILFLPHYAVCVLCAVVITLYRLVTKKDLLKWNTFAHSAKKAGKGKAKNAAGAGLPGGRAEPGEGAENGKAGRGGTERGYLLGAAEKTWAYFKDTLVKEYNFLPCDNYQEEGGKGFAPRTSPTNIGFGLTAAVSASHFGFIGENEAVTLITNTLATVKKLPKYKGHLYNWYDVVSLKSLYPDYVSSVDSGNFCACLIAVRGYLQGLLPDNAAAQGAPLPAGSLLTRPAEPGSSEAAELPAHVNEIEGAGAEEAGGKLSADIRAKARKALKYIDSYLSEIDFSCLYDKRRHLFYIGYNKSSNKFSDSRYDLLASEAHLLSITALALDKIENKNWLFLSRGFVKYKGVLLRAWSGGMFEYLMASLFIDYKKRTLIFESNRNAVRGQIRFAKKHRLPLFGISESQYNLTDNNGNYQYKAFGVNAVSLKPMSAHKVISPYSSFLALEYDAGAALNNLTRAEEYKLFSEKYGFYEAADFTAGGPAVIRTWMAHHQGMILSAIDNYLNGGALKKYFGGDDRIAAASLLLTEKPYGQRAKKKKLYKYKESKEKREETYFSAVNPKLKNAVNLLSGGKYHVLTDARSRGFSVFDGVNMTRRRNGLSGDYGFRFFILDAARGEVFDSFAVAPEKAVFRAYESVHTYQWNSLIITLTTAVSAAYNTELRKVTVMNRGEAECDLRLASYFEPLLCSVYEDIAHPAFSNLFIETAFSEEDKAVTVRRNNKAAPVLIHSVAGLSGIACETSRFNFFKRVTGGLKGIYDRNPLPGNTGFVLEPCVSLSGYVKIAPKAEAAADFFIAGARGAEAARKITVMFGGLNAAKNILMQARLISEPGKRGGAESVAASNAAAYKLLSAVPEPAGLAAVYGRRANLQGLILKGINLNYPIMVFNVKDISDCAALKRALENIKPLYGFLLRFNFVVTFSERHGYSRPIFEAVSDTVDAAGLRDKIGADGGIILYNTAQEYYESAECIKYLAFIVE